jgi:DNA-binding NarL/FixJ family response regulator
MIRALIADDEALARDGIRLRLRDAADVEVVGEAGDGHEAIEAAHKLSPDVVLMDIRMPKLDGLAAARRLAVPPSKLRGLILTTFDLDEYVYDALRAGASGFLLKDAPADQLVSAIRIVAAGEALLAPSVTRRLIAEFVRRPSPAVTLAQVEALTARELEVLKLVAVGLSNGVLPRWLGWLAAVTAPALLVNGLFFSANDAPAFLLFLLWLVATSVVLTRRAGAAATPATSPEPVAA